MNFGTSNSNFAFSQVSTNNQQRNSNISLNVENGGLFSKDQCKALARQIITAYDRNGDGVCDTMEVAKWMVDCYRAMNKSFQPTATDIASYMQVVDKNRNGKISAAELEIFIITNFHNTNRN